MTDVVIYSAIYGDYEAPKLQPDLGDARLLLFTDNRDIEAPGWEVVHEPLLHEISPMYRAKYWKTHPPKADVSIWLDGSLTVSVPDFVGRCLAALGDDDASFTPHPWRDCIYDEAEASCGIGRYPEDAVRAQVALYRELGHPEHWGLFASGAMTRRDNDVTRRLGHRWWYENVMHTWQDQLSLPVAVRGTLGLAWNANMPWEQWWSISGRAWG